MSWTHAGQYGPVSASNALGSPLEGVAFTVYNKGTTTKASLYTDRTMGTAAANPGVTDADGNLTFWAAPGFYDVLCNGLTLSVVVNPDPTDLSAPATGLTGIAIASANGFTGSSDGGSPTATATLGLGVSGILKGVGGAIGSASAGTDYIAPGGALGTPSSLTLTNATGLPESGVTGLVTDLASKTGYLIPRIVTGVTTAAAGDFVIQTGTGNITLPAGVDKARVGVSNQSGGVQTVLAAGSDTFDLTSSGTAFLPFNREAAVWQYSTTDSKWHTLSDSLDGTTLSNKFSTYVIGGADVTAGGTVQKINGTVLSSLATGLLKNTATTGVPSIAVAGTDYSVGTGALATGIVKSTTTTGALSTVTAPAGAIVGTSDTQALTNKDLTGAGNTFPTFNQNTSGTAANLSGTPTLPLGTAATTGTLGDNTTNVATNAFVHNAIATLLETKYTTNQTLTSSAFGAVSNFLLTAASTATIPVAQGNFGATLTIRNDPGSTAAPLTITAPQVLYPVNPVGASLGTFTSYACTTTSFCFNTSTNPVSPAGSGTFCIPQNGGGVIFVNYTGVVTGANPGYTGCTVATNCTAATAGTAFVAASAFGATVGAGQTITLNAGNSVQLESDGNNWVPLASSAMPGYYYPNLGNLSIGSKSLQNVTPNPTSANAGCENTAIGVASQQNLTSGKFNISIGQTSLLFNQTGQDNVSIGNDSMLGVTGNSHSYNTTVGSSGMYGITTGSRNTAMGYGVGNKGSTVTHATGSDNTWIGYQTGEKTGGSAARKQSTILGSGALVQGDNAIAIGYQTSALAAGAVAIGVDNGHTDTVTLTNGAATFNDPTATQADVGRVLTGTGLAGQTVSSVVAGVVTMSANFTGTTGSTAVTFAVAGATTSTALQFQLGTANHLVNVSGRLTLGSTMVQPALLPNTWIASTIPVWANNSATLANPTSGSLRLVAIWLPANTLISNLIFNMGSTAGATVGNVWMALYDSSRVMLATTTTNVTSPAISGSALTATTTYTCAISTTNLGANSTFTTTYSGIHFIGLMIAATTVGTLAGAGTGTGITGVQSLAPAGASGAMMAFTSSTETGLSTVTGFPHTVGGTLTATAIPCLAVS